MRHFLRKAFDKVRDRIEPIFSHTNLWLVRMMTDNKFLSVPSSRITSKPLRKLMEYYDAGQSIGREKLFQAMHVKNVAGDFSPRPIMKLASALAYEGATILPRLATTYPGMTALTLTAVAAAAFAVAQGPQGVADLAATWMGSRTGNKLPLAGDGQNQVAFHAATNMILMQDSRRSFPRDTEQRTEVSGRGERVGGYNSLNPFGLI